MKQPYRTAAEMPTKEIQMRKITTQEKDDKKSSIEAFRGVQFGFLVAGVLSLAVSVGCVTNSLMYVSQGSALGIVSIGAFAVSLFATKHVNNLRKVVDTYWEQQSEK
jgi:hypothetical protein